jgi:hypothetical protein
MAFSSHIARAFTREKEREIAKKVDGWDVEPVELDGKSIDVYAVLNILFNMIGFPAFTGYYFLDTMASGNDEMLTLIMGAVVAVFTLSRFVNSFKTHEYLMALKNKMRELDLDEVVAFVDMISYRANKMGNF